MDTFKQAKWSKVEVLRRMEDSSPLRRGKIEQYLSRMNFGVGKKW